jgi:hypothetical protein
MRDILNIFDSLLMEKARGLLYRAAGDSFFQGNKDNPTAEITFRDAKYFPGMPGSYASYDEMSTVLQDINSEYPNIQWYNKPNKANKAFAILSFDGPAAGQKTYFGRFFNDIKPDMAGFWKNSELPGGWQLNKSVSLKGSYYKLKPADLFEPNSTFASPQDCVQALAANPKNNPAVPKILPGMETLLSGKMPTFENVGDMASAVRDDLGETIGPIALVQGMITSGGAEAARKDILGANGSFEGSSINFPAAKNNGLVDSYLLHPSGQEIGISSKGEKGASASAKNIADGVAAARAKGLTKLLKAYAPQIEVIEEVGRLSSVDFPLVLGERQGLITKPQADIVRDLIRQGATDISQYQMNQQDREALENLMADYKPKDNPRYNVGYHILSSLARKVSTNINKDPKFGEAALKFLNVSPIIQLHLNGSDRGGNYAVTGFSSKYPPDFRGTVGLDASKVYAATGIVGRVSFSYNGGGDLDTDVATDQAPVTTTDLDQEVERQRLTGPGVRAARAAQKTPRDSEKALGRSRRRG